MSTSASAAAEVVDLDDVAFIEARVAHMWEMARLLDNYADQLALANPAFPFERRTRQSGMRELPCSWMRSSVPSPSSLGFVGVRAEQRVTGECALLPYPGVLMTPQEYERMPYHIPTGVDLRIPAHDGKDRQVVLVGFPNFYGPAIMDARGTGRGINCRLEHLPGDEGFNWERTPENEKIRVPNNLIHVAGSDVRRNEELFLSYGEGFWQPEPNYLFCCVCDRRPQTADQRIQLRVCSQAGCTNRFHQQCVDNGRFCPRHVSQPSAGERWVTNEIVPFVEACVLSHRRTRRTGNGWLNFYFVQMSRADFDAIPGRPSLAAFQSMVRRAMGNTDTPLETIVEPSAATDNNYVLVFRRHLGREWAPPSRAKLLEWTIEHHPLNAKRLGQEEALYRTWIGSDDERRAWITSQKRVSTSSKK